MLCQPTACSLTMRAPAKLNLFLRVVRRREDGFHDLETVMTAINLYDTLVFKANDSSDVTLKIVMGAARDQHAPPQPTLPTGPNNLVIRAATLLKDYAKVAAGAEITLIKRIPSEAGLGGGSSDAATTLKGLSRLWNISLTQDELFQLAAKLGSDVGFFVGKTATAVCRGRGERVDPLQAPVSQHFVVAKPASGLSTPAVFKQCEPGRTQTTVEEFVRTLPQSQSHHMVRLLHNDLQSPAELLNEDVQHLRNLFNKLPVFAHQMTGSGTSYFGICSSSRHARSMAARLKASGIPWVYVVRSCTQ